MRCLSRLYLDLKLLKQSPQNRSPQEHCTGPLKRYDEQLEHRRSAMTEGFETILKSRTALQKSFVKCRNLCWNLEFQKSVKSRKSCARVQSTCNPWAPPFLHTYVRIRTRACQQQQRSNCCRSRKCIRGHIPMHAIFTVFIYFFIPVLSRSYFTSRTPDKNQKIEQLFYFLLAQVPQSGEIHELRGERFCACCPQALEKVPRAKSG